MLNVNKAKETYSCPPVELRLGIFTRRGESDILYNKNISEKCQMTSYLYCKRVDRTHVTADFFCSFTNSA